MTTTQQAAQYAERWRALRAWRRPLTEARLCFKPRQTGAWGFACATTRDAIIAVVEWDLAATLSTVLHELAHLAAPAGTQHGMPWRERYCQAVLEVTGTYVPADFGGDYNLLDAAAEDALRFWLKQRGIR